MFIDCRENGWEKETGERERERERNSDVREKPVGCLLHAP